MTAVRAARWDITWERGGHWTARLVRRAANGTVLGIEPPCRLEVRGVDDPSTEPALLIVTATIAGDGAAATLLATAEQIESLPRETYQYRILLGDTVTHQPLVKARGYVTINDQVGG